MMADPRSAAFGVAPHTIATGIPASPENSHLNPRGIDYDTDMKRQNPFDASRLDEKRSRPNTFIPNSPALMNASTDLSSYGQYPAGTSQSGTNAGYTADVYNNFSSQQSQQAQFNPSVQNPRFAPNGPQNYANNFTGAPYQNFVGGFGTPSMPQTAFASMAQASPMMNMGTMGMGAMGAGANGNMNNMGMQAFSPMNNTNNMMNGQSQSAGTNVSSGSVGRTIYVGNLPADASVDELLTQVRFGPIESVKILPEKSCAFISFLDPNTAAAFHSDALMRKITLHGQELKVGWGKPSAVPANILQAVQANNATRNVYLGGLDENMTETQLRDELSRFGAIDQVKIVRDKNIGFVHFLSIQTAIKAVQTLSTDAAWAGKRANYGKDRCAYVPKSQHQQQQHNMAAAQMAANVASFATSYSLPGYGGNLQVAGHIDQSQIQAGNRTVYLGNVHPDATLEEICNTIRGGILQQIRYIQERHIAFVTFVDPNAAVAFFTNATLQGISLHNKRLKIGWGKHSGPTSPAIASTVAKGGSRNTYIGQIHNWDKYTEEKLRSDFGAYGELELVNLLKEKNCAFVNFTNIANAIKAIEAIKSHEDYVDLKIAFGKDRCGNPPRNSYNHSHKEANQGGASPDNEADDHHVEVTNISVSAEDLLDSGSPTA